MAASGLYYGKYFELACPHEIYYEKSRNVYEKIVPPMPGIFSGHFLIARFERFCYKAIHNRNGDIIMVDMLTSMQHPLHQSKRILSQLVTQTNTLNFPVPPTPPTFNSG